MSHIVDFENLSTTGLEPSLDSEALAGSAGQLRAGITGESRSMKFRLCGQRKLREPGIRELGIELSALTVGNVPVSGG